MSEVLEQENAIILAAAQKFVALGSDIAQRSIAGQESGEQEEHSDKILKYLTVYRKGTSLETKALEAILYALRDLSEANIFPTVDPIVGQSIQYLVSQSATTISDTMQIQNKGSNLTLVDTINFDNFLTAAYDSGNSRVNLTLGGTASQNTTMTLGAFNLTLNASGAGGFGITFGSDADYDIFYRASGKWARLAFAGTDGHVLSRVGGVLAWAAQTSSGYDTIQNAGAGVTQRATVNFSGALQAIDDGSSKTNVTVKNAGITYAMIQNVTNSRLLGNATGSAAAPSEISVSGPLALGSSILSIAQAGASADGYLAASDWNAFNGKLGTSLNSGYLFVGSGINVATGVPMSGDASLASNGAITVTWANGYPTYDARYLTLSGGTLTGFLTLHADPSNAMHAATKNYVDNLITGISWKNEVVTATTANITLSGEQTIDGILTSGSRVLVKDQTTATENGIYLTGAGAWTRTTDADTGTEIAMATVYVAGGSTHGGTQWTCTNTAVTIGSTNISFGQISGTGTYTNGAGLTLTGNTFSITTNGVVNSLIRPSGALSVIGRSVNSTGDVADISAFVDGDVLRRSGTTLGFGTIGDTSITGLSWSKITGTPTTLAGYGITDSFSSSLSSGNIFVGSGGGVATGVSMSSEATIDNTGAVTLSNAAVIGKVLTGYTSGAGTVAATDTILEAIQKLNGNAFVDPMTTRGDIICRNSSNVTARLPIGSATYVLTSDGIDVAWAPAAGGGGALSALTAATGTNTINNVGYAQEWQWNSLAGAVGLKLSSTSTAAASNAQALLEVNLSGANATSTQTTYAGRFVNTHTGTSSTNIGAYFEATGGTENVAIHANGNTLFGTSYIATQGRVHVVGETSDASKNIIYLANSTALIFRMVNRGEIVYSPSSYNIGNGNLSSFSFTRSLTNTTGSSTYIGYDNKPTYNLTAGTPTVIGYNYQPTETSLTGTTHLAFRSTSSTAAMLLGGSTLTADAILDLQSTTKAFIPPRMTTTQRDAIGTPSAGMLLYDTTEATWYGYSSSWGRIDNNPLGIIEQRAVDSTGWTGSSTTAVFQGSDLSDGESISIDVHVVMTQSSGTPGATGFSFTLHGGFRKSSGTLTQIGSSTQTEVLNDTGDSFVGTPSLSVSSGAVVLSITLTTAKTFKHSYFIKVYKN